jgi:hypothetical protein
MSMSPKQKEKKTVIESSPKSRIKSMAGKSLSTLSVVIADLANHDDRTREKARHTLEHMGK